MRKFLLPAIFVKVQFKLSLIALKMFYTFIYQLCVDCYKQLTFKNNTLLFSMHMNMRTRDFNNCEKQLSTLKISFDGIDQPVFKVFKGVEFKGGFFEASFTNRFAKFLKTQEIPYVLVSLDALYGFEYRESIQLYILLAKYQRIKKTNVMPIDKLKNYLGLNQNIRTNNFLSRHLNGAMIEIAKYFDVKTVKTYFKNKLVSIQFMYDTFTTTDEEILNDEKFDSFFRFGEKSKQKLFDKYSKEIVMQKAQQIYNMAGENKIFHVKAYLKKLLFNHFSDKKKELDELELSKLEGDIGALKSKLISSYESFVTINFNELLNNSPTNVFLECMRQLSDAFSKSIYGDIFLEHGLRSALVQAQLFPIVRSHYPNLFERLAPFNDYVFKNHQEDFGALREMIARLERLKNNRPKPKQYHANL